MVLGHLGGFRAQAGLGFRVAGLIGSGGLGRKGLGRVNAGFGCQGSRFMGFKMWPSFSTTRDLEFDNGPCLLEFKGQHAVEWL